MSKRSMGRGSGGRRPPGGAPRLTPGILAAAALSVLVGLALPVAAADGGPRPFAGGPSVSEVTVVPQPVVPDIVTVTANASDPATPVADAEFFIDAPGFPRSRFSFQMQPADMGWDEFAEGLFWANSYDVFTFGGTLGAGPHVLYVHAMNALGTWGDFTTLPFSLMDPATAGPSTMAITATPSTITAGASLAVTAAINDWFKRNVTAAEVIFDISTPRGSGSPMQGAWGQGVTATWTGIPPDLSFGNHPVWARGYNGVAWGAPLGTTFTVQAPSFTFGLAASPTVARPGDLVTYALTFENHGNANATFVWVNVTFPPALTYADDNATSVGGTRSPGTTLFLFTNVTQRAYAFGLRALVSTTATDGIAPQATAGLDFTNAIGHDFPAIFASASATVVAPEVVLTLSAPSVAYGGQTVTLTATIANTGVRTIPVVDVVLTGSSDLEFVADSAAAIGGVATGPGAWRFTDVPRGSQAFDITERVPLAAADGEPLSWTATASYVPRVGTTTPVAAAATSTVARPALTASVEPESSQVPEGGQVRITIHFANEGSVAANSVRLTAILSPGLARVGGDLPTASRGGEHTWDFASVKRGAYAITIVAQGRAAGAGIVLVRLAYTSPDGVPFPTVEAATVVTVTAPTPPILYVSVGLMAAVAGLGAFVATERGKTSLLFLFIPLYTRLRHEHVLDHETRGMIRGYIVANPGDHYNAIKEALELPNGTLAYHIQVLQKESIVKSVKDGKFRRFYPYEMRLPEGGVPTKIQRVILDLIRANPGITPRDAAALLGLTPSTVSYHIEKLEDLDRIEYRREGISKRLYVRIGGRS